MASDSLTTGDTRPAKTGRLITSVNDMADWLKSPGYKDYLGFIQQLNQCAKGIHHRHLNRRELVKQPVLISTIKLLDQLDQLVDEVKPFEDDKTQRFGNLAFRNWYDEMKELVTKTSEEEFGLDDAQELVPYLLESFGNQQRIDYGTGHEMCFVIFLMGIYKLKLTQMKVPPKDEMQAHSLELLTVFAVAYMSLVRKIQLAYRLEPAGSHGAFSLDDFQFLPFYFGSAQLIGHPELMPQTFPEAGVAQKHKNDYMFYGAIDFIHQVKKGPFGEHSNQLWNISGVDDWAKINKGLLNMYLREYLPKFPIVHHLYFGRTVLVWK